ncbi:hypothetical protein V1283_003768 [Bradyrhizobium sp. AZCC 2262]
MLARTPCPNVRKYASQRVFEGTRPLSADRVAKLRANYYRTQTTPVFRLVVQPARRVWRLLVAR